MCRGIIIQSRYANDQRVNQGQVGPIMSILAEEKTLSGMHRLQGTEDEMQWG